MTKLPKGPLKVIHINRRAIGENETRSRATLTEPRRLIPPISVWTKAGKVEGFGLRVKGEVRLRYDVMRFTPGFEFGTPDIRVWIETESAVEIADKAGEFDDAPSTEEETPAHD